jgi:transcription antitermination protein NusB
MSGRSAARRLVLQMLFLIDQNQESDPERIRASLSRELQDPAVREFAFKLFDGVAANREAIDALIRQTAANWKLERMLPTDRNVLRMGIYELRYFNTPPPVALNEAIEIAREFGTKNSAAFVNGILDKLIPSAADAAATDTK